MNVVLGFITIAIAWGITRVLFEIFFRREDAGRSISQRVIVSFYRWARWWMALAAALDAAHRRFEAERSAWTFNLEMTPDEGINTERNPLIADS